MATTAQQIFSCFLWTDCESKWETFPTLICRVSSSSRSVNVIWLITFAICEWNETRKCEQFNIGILLLSLVYWYVNIWCHNVELFSSACKCMHDSTMRFVFNAFWLLNAANETDSFGYIHLTSNQKGNDKSGTVAKTGPLQNTIFDVKYQGIFHVYCFLDR